MIYKKNRRLTCAILCCLTLSFLACAPETSEEGAGRENVATPELVQHAEALTTAVAVTPEFLSPQLIAQELTSLTPDAGMEQGVSDWKGNVKAETELVAAGEQALRLNGVHFFLKYSHKLIPISGGTYYKLSLQAAADNISISPTVSFTFYAADGSTRLGESRTLIDLRGTAPYREFSSPYQLAPDEAAFVGIGVAFPKGNRDAKLLLDEVHLYELSNLPVRLVSTYESISVYVSRASQVPNEEAHVYYREAGSSQWYESFAPEFDAERGEYRSSIVGLNEGRDYEVQVVLEADGLKLDEAGATVSTWDGSPPIGQTISVASLYEGGQLLIESMHGEPDAWIKITGTGTADIDGGYDDEAALKIVNSSYLIFENIGIQGGRRHAVQVQMSDQIRIVDCEMSGWARKPNFTDGKFAYETESDMKRGMNRAINKDAGVYLDASSRVTVERCYMHDPRSGANNWGGYNHPAGPSAIYVRNIADTQTKLMKGNFVVRYNDLIGSDDLRWNDVIEGENNENARGSFYRDSDIYGNMLAFANDDSTEMDGGQMNTRFFGNRIENCFVGLSLTPCVVGPSYVYQNLIFDLGDDRNACFSMVKLGGGDTYSKGKSYFFNNTIIGKGNGLTGVGYGSDSNRAMFLVQSRNNIIQTTNSHPDYSRTISDPGANAWNSFDYDNLSTLGQERATVNYTAGQEPNGILDAAPTFINAEAGDFRLASDSSGIDDGIALLNFADQFRGSAPDQGAIEFGSSSLFPIRPIAVSADKYIVKLSASADGASSPVEVALSAGDLEASLEYEVRMNHTVDWLQVTPAKGSLSANSTQTLSFSLQSEQLEAGEDIEATILVRFKNGFSVPITVRADVQ
ncbi:MAG: hypothetical protein CML13_01625 [Puniceicoccaceae bacterium]|nr:hypothetical protein [Puniceicoccaceae bacterium]